MLGVVSALMGGLWRCVPVVRQRGWRASCSALPEQWPASVLAFCNGPWLPHLIKAHLEYEEAAFGLYGHGACGRRVSLRGGVGGDGGRLGYGVAREAAAGRLRCLLGSDGGRVPGAFGDADGEEEPDAVLGRHRGLRPGGASWPARRSWLGAPLPSMAFVAVAAVGFVAAMAGGLSLRMLMWIVGAGFLFFFEDAQANRSAILNC